MTSFNPEMRDRLAEPALPVESPPRVPRRLFRRIKERLAVIRLIQQERRRFRYSVAAATGLIAGLVGAALLLALVTGYSSGLLGGTPGGLGYFDYVKTQVLLTLSSAL